MNITIKTHQNMNYFNEGDYVLAPSKYSKLTERGQILSIRNGVYAYVRFENHDKRFDEWIPTSSLAMIQNKPQKKQPTNKIKANAKSANESNIRNIDTIRIGKYDIDCWYYSPYSPSYTKARHLYICEFCLMYYTSPEMYSIHHHNIETSRPCGYEIYRKNALSIFEIESNADRLYCQSLFLLSKLFIEESSLSYNVDNVTFYVLCNCDNEGAHFVGCFCRPTNWMGNIIVSEIFVLPPYQRQGYSQILLSCAYEIAHRSNVIGGPRKPLTSLGRLAFEKFFRNTIIQLFLLLKKGIYTIHEISMQTSISKNDIISTLENIKILEDDTADENVEIQLNQIFDYINKHMNNDTNEKKIPTNPVFDKEYLLWYACQIEYDEEEQYNDSSYDSDYEKSTNEKVK